MELRNEKDAQFIIRHHVTEEKLLHLEKGVRKLGFQSGGKRIMSIFLGLFLLCMAAKVVIGGTIGDALMMIGILCAMGCVFGTYALLKGWLDAKKHIITFAPLLTGANILPNGEPSPTLPER